MSNEQDGKPAAPRAKTRDEENYDLGRAIMGHAYGGSSVGISTTGEIHSLNARSDAQKEEARQETDAGVEAAGVKFATLSNQLTKMQETLTKQADEIEWLRTERAKGTKKSSKKDRK